MSHGDFGKRVNHIAEVLAYADLESILWTLLGLDIVNRYQLSIDSKEETDNGKVICRTVYSSTKWRDESGDVEDVQ